MALSVLSRFSAGEIARVVASSDVSALQSVQGVGKKTAERILLELSHKFASKEAHGFVPADGPRAEAVEALVALEIPRAEAFMLVQEAAAMLPEEQRGDVPRLVSEALSRWGLARGKRR